MLGVTGAAQSQPHLTDPAASYCTSLHVEPIRSRVPFAKSTPSWWEELKGPKLHESPPLAGRLDPRKVDRREAFQLELAAHFGTTLRCKPLGKEIKRVS